jgi:protein-S-isoprenylcysteine O-methyltransferase Ste14
MLEGAAIFLAFAFAQPPAEPEPFRLGISAVLEILAAVMAWHAVRSLGRQFRIHAGVYHDHELVRTGPYALVRHPIYTSLLGMMLATMLSLRTSLAWSGVALALFIAGTEIRIRSEEALLEAKFGDAFHAYRKAVSAYIPFVR